MLKSFIGQLLENNNNTTQRINSIEDSLARHEASLSDHNKSLNKRILAVESSMFKVCRSLDSVIATLQTGTASPTGSPPRKMKRDQEGRHSGGRGSNERRGGRGGREGRSTDIPLLDDDDSKAEESDICPMTLLDMYTQDFQQSAEEIEFDQEFEDERTRNTVQDMQTQETEPAPSQETQADNQTFAKERARNLPDDKADHKTDNTTTQASG